MNRRKRDEDESAPFVGSEDGGQECPPPDMGGERIMPHSLELEEQVLGAMMMSPVGCARAISALEPHGLATVFYRGSHREIFGAIVRLYEAKMPPDLSLVAEELEKRGKLEEVGGPSKLADIVTSVGTSANVEYHCRALVEKSIRRRMIAMMDRAGKALFDATTNVDDLLESIEAEMLSITMGQESSAGGPKLVSDALYATYDRIEAIRSGSGNFSGLETGYPALDATLGGLQRGELIVVAARPSMGKSAFVHNLAIEIARRGVGVALYSLEMSNESVGARMLARESRIDSHRFTRGNLSEDQMTVLQETIARMQELPIAIDDRSDLTPLSFRARCRRQIIEKIRVTAGQPSGTAREYPVGVAILDYLSLVHVGHRTESREREVAEITWSLKQFAREEKMPVVLVVQVTRDSAKRSKNPRPELMDLRESGAVEQDSDTVIFVHRPEYYGVMQDEEGRSLEGVAEILIKKQRNGPTGRLWYDWIDRYQRFDERPGQVSEDGRPRDLDAPPPEGPHDTGRRETRAEQDDLPF